MSSAIAAGIQPNAAQIELLAWRVSHGDGLTKDEKAYIFDLLMAKAGTRSENAGGLCPENMQPCDMGCKGGWCVTLHGSPGVAAAHAEEIDTIDGPCSPAKLERFDKEQSSLSKRLYSMRGRIVDGKAAEADLLEILAEAAEALSSRSTNTQEGTPRTDAFVLKLNPTQYQAQQCDVSAVLEHARQLERELANAVKVIALHKPMEEDLMAANKGLHERLARSSTSFMPPDKLDVALECVEGAMKLLRERGYQEDSSTLTYLKTGRSCIREFLEMMPRATDSRSARANHSDTERLDYLAKTLHIDATGDEPIHALFIPGTENMTLNDWDLRKLVDHSMELTRATDSRVPK